MAVSTAYVSARQPEGAHGAVEDIRDSQRTVGAREADVQDRRDLGVILEVAKLHGRAAVDHHDDFVEVLLGKLDERTFVGAYAKRVLCPVCLGVDAGSAGVVVAALGAGTRDHHDCRVTVLGEAAGKVLARAALGHIGVKGGLVGHVRGREPGRTILVGNRLHPGRGVYRRGVLNGAQGLVDAGHGWVDIEAALLKRRDKVDGVLRGDRRAHLATQEGIHRAHAQERDLCPLGKRKGLTLVLHEDGALLANATAKVLVGLHEVVRRSDARRELVVCGLLGTCRPQRRVDGPSPGISDAMCARQPEAGRQRKGNSTAARDLLLFYPHPIAPSNCVIAGRTLAVAPATPRAAGLLGIRAVCCKKRCHI